MKHDLRQANRLGGSRNTPTDVRYKIHFVIVVSFMVEIVFVIFVVPGIA